LANRRRFRSEDVAFRGDAPGYLGDVLRPVQYSDDQAYIRGTVFDHLGDFHEPPVICRGWQITEDFSVPGAYQVAPGVGVGLDGDRVPRRLETEAAVEGLLPVDGSSGVANYIIARYEPVDGTAESSWLDGNLYVQTQTDGCSITVTTSPDPAVDVVLGAIFPTGTANVNRLMVQPFRSKDLSGPTGKAGSGVNLIPNSRMTSTYRISSTLHIPDWWAVDGSTPEQLVTCAGGYLEPPYLECKFNDGEGLVLQLPAEVAGQLNSRNGAVLSFLLRKVESGGEDPVTVQVEGFGATGWEPLASLVLYPRYITEFARFASRFKTQGFSIYRLRMRNAAGTGNFAHFAITGLCVNVGDYAPLLPIPTGLYSPESVQFDHAGGLTTSGYLKCGNLAGDFVEVQNTCYLGRIRVYAGTAATGGDTVIAIQRNGVSVKELTLPNGGRTVAGFGGDITYVMGERLSVYASWSGVGGPSNLAVTVERLNLVGV